MLEHESVIPWTGTNLRFGTGATSDVGFECAQLDCRRALIVTDANIQASGMIEEVVSSLNRHHVQSLLWAGAQTEPTDLSIAQAMLDLQEFDFDGIVAVGGGSSIDTAKILNLLTAHGGSITDWVAPPHGSGRPIPGPLHPLIALPTTAGTGSECTAMAVIDLVDTHTKAAVSDPLIRPALAIIDPLNTIGCPPAVTASAGYDTLVQALESLTSRPIGDRPRAASPGERPLYVGLNPLSRIWSEESIRQASRFLRRAVADGTDLEAREGMALAALCSRLGNSGVHLPHANAYAIARQARSYRPSGFVVDRDLVPHGQSVIATAPAAFTSIYEFAAEQCDRAAQLLGVDREKRLDAPRTAVGDWLADLVEATGGPGSLEHFGLSHQNIPEMVGTALRQERVLAGSPTPATEDLLTSVFEASFSSRA